MGFSKLMTLVFGIAFIIILYFIIYYALKIMYKDVKGGGRKRQSSTKKNYGIEVLSTGENSNLEEGSILLLRGTITIGRREGNTIKLDDQYASGNHAKIIVKNNEIVIEDLNSTNGIFINDERINEFAKIRANDKIRIGSAIFKVIRAEKN
ncbi:FHA-domain containing secreted protein [Clostridium sartagoforme AAU1]|uniref:FHA-domain containing secreted protein n=1 Tax=Clostridium sartagoforme AAU1 TaxID=1202534 RepID=R9C760_9CLOT|nr:FHA domain-containing protein [Clostridium sartagoforme]EOR25204.1 FHA-domain containing secreted protein [Clostridium sartagoforme AAU1]